MFALLGVANNALYLGLGYTGLQTVSAGLGGLIVSANPVFTAVLAALFLGEALTWRKVAGLLLGIGGVGFIVWHRLSVGTDSMRRHLVHAGIARLDRGRHHPVQAAGAEGQPVDRQRHPESRRRSGAAAVRFRVCRCRRHRAEHAAAWRVRLSGARRIDLRLSAVVSSVEDCGATAASAYHFLMPPLGMLFAFLVLGEHIEIRDLIGIVPVALGIYLVTRPAPLSH